MKVELTRNEVNNIFGCIMQLNGSYPVRFKYALSKNKKIFRSEVEEIVNATKSRIEGFDKYESERIEILKQYCECDVNGQIIAPNGQVQPLKGKKDSLTAALKTLDEKFTDVLDKRKEEIKEIESFMSEKITIDVHSISNADIPEELNQLQYDSLFPLIVDEKESEHA